jgi:glycosyltransferase involved in cell wall biosynthesis
MPWGSDILTEPDDSFLKKQLVKKVMNQCDHIQCDAEFVKQKIINDYRLSPDKITVFPWGIDLNLFKRGEKLKARESLKLDGNKFILIYNRYLENIYGVQYLLEAFKIFSQDKDDVLLLMLSEGSLRNQTVRYISNNKLDAKINLIGKVSNNELPAFLNSADVYVSPSLSDGTSLSLLEAMACGRGLVVTDVSAIKEWVNEKNGLVVTKKNPKELAASMQQYYDNRDLIKQHGDINIQIAGERANWDNNYLKLKKIYNNLLSLN